LILNGGQESALPRDIRYVYVLIQQNQRLRERDIRDISTPELIPLSASQTEYMTE
jgi:hypothetical protein